MATWFRRPIIEKSSLRPALRSDGQHMHLAERLLAPRGVDLGAHRAADAFRQRIGIAPLRARQVLEGGYHNIIDPFVDRLAVGILFRNAGEIDLRIVGEFTLL